MLFFRQLLSAEKLCFFHRGQNSLNFSDPTLQMYLKKLVLEHDDLNTKTKRTTIESRRLFELKPIINVLEQRIFTLNDGIESIKELGNQQGDDILVNKMIKEEALIYLKRIKEVDGALQSVLLEPQLTEGGVLLEVTAGVGGRECMLFARELFEMYESYAKYKDWEVDIASLEKSNIGGIRKASMLLEGLGVLELMKMEGGVHRVQKISAAESDGRIYTNSVSVAILPQPAEIEVTIPESDIVVETKRAMSGDGTHVNTIDSAVRILHIPTGTVVECQEGRSQIKNKEIAKQKLRTLLLAKQHQEQTSKINNERKLQIDYSKRNAKIRTYNYPQDRVIEHREGGGTIHNLQGFMEGTEVLENLQDCLLRQQKHQMFLEEINRLSKKRTFKLL